MDGYADLVDDLLGLPDEKERSSEEKRQPETSAVDLAIAGDVDGLAQLLKDDADFAVNARSPKTGRALLHEACARGQLEVVKFLLQKTDADLMLRTMLVSELRRVCRVGTCVLMRVSWLSGPLHSASLGSDQQSPRRRVPPA
jgi:hypothetical protein